MGNAGKHGNAGGNAGRMGRMVTDESVPFTPHLLHLLNRTNPRILSMTGVSREGLYSPASSRQPSGGRLGAIVGPCIEGNRGAWGSLTNSVDGDFE